MRLVSGLGKKQNLILSNFVMKLALAQQVVSPWLMIPTANFCRDKSATYVRNLIQGSVALMTAAKGGLSLIPLWNWEYIFKTRFLFFSYF